MTKTTVPVSYCPAPGQTPVRVGVPFTMLVTPLARAALDNGVSFEDVKAYVASRRVTDPELEAAWYEAVNVPEVWPPTAKLAATTTSMVTDTLLEGALMRSVLALGTIESARLWWRGVL